MTRTFPDVMRRPVPVLLALSTAVFVILCALLSPPAAAEEPAVEVDPHLEPLGRWLEGEDGVLKAMAAFELGRHDRPGAVHLAVGVLTTEEDDVVLGCALGGIARRTRPELVAEGGPLLAGLLVRLVGHDHPGIRERAWQALRTIAGDDVASSSADLRAWWLRGRHRLAEEQKRMLAARGKPSERLGTPLAPGETETVPSKVPIDMYDYVMQLRRDGLEVCIVLDHTGSMGPVIGLARSRAEALVKRLGWLVPRFRAALVTYDDGARLRTALTQDGAALEKAFSKVAAGGGGDWEEGVDKGIALALRQDRVAWSRSAWRVIVVIGDAPPHAGDVPGLIRRIQKARRDDLYDHPVIVSTVSTQAGGVDHFGPIAIAGGGIHVTLGNTTRLVEELVALSFGSAHRDRVEPWLKEVRELRGRAPKR